MHVTPCETSAEISASRMRINEDSKTVVYYTNTSFVVNSEEKQTMVKYSSYQLLVT